MSLCNIGQSSQLGGNPTQATGISVFQRQLRHRLPDSNCWDIDLFIALKLHQGSTNPHYASVILSFFPLFLLLSLRFYSFFLYFPPFLPFFFFVPLLIPSFSQFSSYVPFHPFRSSCHYCFFFLASTPISSPFFLPCLILLIFPLISFVTPVLYVVVNTSSYESTRLG